MKKVLIILLILVAFILLFPIREQAKDGGTVLYNAILYDVYDVHRISTEEDKDFDEGIVVKVLGYEVFNNVK